MARFHVLFVVRAKGSRRNVMMTQDLNIRTDALTVEQLAAVLSILDYLHDVACEGKLAQVINLPEAEVIGLLQDIRYTASETIREIKGADRPDTTIGWEDYEVIEQGGLDA